MELQNNDEDEDTKVMDSLLVNLDERLNGHRDNDFMDSLLVNLDDRLNDYHENKS